MKEQHSFYHTVESKLNSVIFCALDIEDAIVVNFLGTPEMEACLGGYAILAS